ncbi:glycyl-tRNA synthetase beta chain [Amphibacillus marinus]|uniref:Glycine--tRNA ligase beta subunit n=1 Tax=Amphibacillus marinus TaxID=872970 RepID=A0A1H8HIN7_9BACI|nr:glycine--tRNA ligase subunit beta [Amphibacillus marinus]SEN56020.1 glycyl-tRNA synthetase beta chain [Amphibacillus marinus]
MTTNVLFEVGLEEMPARFLADTEKQLHDKTIDWLNQNRLTFERINTFITPRRFAVSISGLADKQTDIEEEVRGPAKKIAQDEAGNWTKAAIGFAKGQGVAVDAIYFKAIKDVDYVHVNKFIDGKGAGELLPAFKEVILSLSFPKNMRWSNRSLRFIRPIKWLVALNGAQIIDFDIEDVKTDRISYGHRFLGSQFSLVNAGEYEQALKQQFVIANSHERKANIQNQIEALAKAQNWQVPIEADLLEEVTQLVEYPTVFFGTFSRDYLTVPEEALITSMKEHQRYFPVRDQANQLLPYFVAVRNGNDQHLANVARGNEKVLNARLADAVFFYTEDQKQSIDSNNEKLSRMVFQEKLGTISDKVNRVSIIANQLASQLGLTDDQRALVTRAADISKFDLVTQMVNEFTNLQGIMGEKYALIAGEDERVAKAINEQYMPRQANGMLPQSTLGAILSVADKLDTIVGCIGVGLMPTGSQDPYALRRQAMAVIQIFIDQKWALTVEQALSLTLTHYQATTVEIAQADAVAEQVRTFIKARMVFLAKEQGIAQDIMTAVMTAQIGVPALVLKKAKLLEEKRADFEFKQTQEALGRVLNLASKGAESAVAPSLFENDAEQGLFVKLEEIKSDFQALMNEQAYVEAIQLLEQLTPLIDQFFEQTMVMAEDQKLRANRLALLKQVAWFVYQFADFNKIEWKQQF